MDEDSKYGFPKRNGSSLKHVLHQGDLLQSDSSHDPASKPIHSATKLCQDQKQCNSGFSSTNCLHKSKSYRRPGEYGDGQHYEAALHSTDTSTSECTSPPSRFISTKIQNNLAPVRLTKSSDFYDRPNQSNTRRNYRSKFTHTQQMKEELYDCLGEKPCNLNEESIVLYQNLDCERRNLLVRKVLSTFMYAAMKKQRERIYKMERSIKVTEEKFAARIVQNALLRNLQGKMKDRIIMLIGENQQLENSLRVTRHSQIMDKEKVMEKQKELNQFKTDIAYIKKMLIRTKEDLDQATNDCEAAQIGNEKLLEEKKKLQRETRSLEERKDMLQTTLGQERKRSEKQRSEIRRLSRQMSDLRIQIAELNSHIDECQVKYREFENSNMELQGLIQAKGNELAKLEKKIDAYNMQIVQLKRDNFEFNQENIALEDHLRNCQRDFKKMEMALVVADNTFKGQSEQIVEIERAVASYQEENAKLKNELYAFKLKNTRSRRAWATFAVILSSPLENIAQLIFGISATTVNASTAQSYQHFQKMLSEPERSKSEN